MVLTRRQSQQRQKEPSDEVVDQATSGVNEEEVVVEDKKETQKNGRSSSASNHQSDSDGEIQKIEQNASDNEESEEKSASSSDAESEILEDADSEEDLEIDRPPPILTSEQWNDLIMNKQFQEIEQAIKWTSKLNSKWRKPFEVHLGNGADIFIKVITRTEKISLKELRVLLKDGHLGTPYFSLLVLRKLCEHFSDLELTIPGKWNLFRYLKLVEISITSPEDFQFHGIFGLKKGLRTLKRAYHELWLKFTKEKLPKKLLKNVVAYCSSSVLKHVTQPHMFADFFFKIFKRGHLFAILALDGIFELVVKHNFEFPDFYEYVYKQTTPAIFYTEYKWHFLQNIDKFLSSSHVPDYIIAGFLKRLSRSLLYAPLDAQESLLSLIKNLLIRHVSLNALVHCDAPESLDDDPYLEDQPLKESQALESSLWEIKAIQGHWFSNVAKRAGFIDRRTEKVESMVRIRDFSEYLEQILDRKFGKELESKNAQFAKSQDMPDSDEEEEAQERDGTKTVNNRKRTKSSKKAAKRARMGTEIAVNSKEPLATFFKLRPNICDFNKFWKK